METFKHEFDINGKHFIVDFSINPDLATGNPVFVDTRDGFTTDVVNKICIRLIHLFKNKEPEHFTYETSEPYWFFHDVCHAIDEPDLLFPKVLTIAPEIEQELVKKGLTLARECKLDEKYIERVDALRPYL